MKKQINPTIKAHLLRSGFYVLLLLAVCVIPFALAQRDTTGRNFAKRGSPGAASAPELQSPALSSWSIVANYPAIIQSPAVSTDGTYAYSGGGSDNFVPIDGFYRYDPVADMWTTLAPLPQALFDARSTYAVNVNKIYVFGGLDVVSNVLDTTYIYDIATDSWTTGAPMPAARFFPAVSYYGVNEKIYVIGGLDSSFAEANQTWEYDPVADTWDTSRASIPMAMGGSATSIVDQNIYLAGSFGPTGGTTLHYRYDILADSWTQMADLPVPVYEAAGAAVGSQTYVVGGGNPAIGALATRQARMAALVKAPAVAYNTTYIYDIPSNTWASGPNTNVPHAFTGGTAVGNLLIVVAGFDGVIGNTNTVETALAEGGTPTPTPSPSVTPSATPTPTPTVTPTATPTPTPGHPPPTPRPRPTPHPRP
jgi:N-acetylneuraminic acid mutarotase